MRLFILGLIFSLLGQFLHGEDWPGWRGTKGNGTWRGPGLAKNLPEEGLRKVWGIGVNPGYSGVTVSNGRVFLMDRPDKENGKERERVICIDQITGIKIWEFVYEAKYQSLDYGKGPRASITIFENYGYGLGAMGHAFCLDLKLGKLIWFRNLLVEENGTSPIWGFSASPKILDDTVLYHVGGGMSGNLLALDLKSGKTKWSVGEDEKAGYAQPLLVSIGNTKQLICWGPTKIMGLPIGGGEEIWNFPYEVKYGVSIAKPIFEEGIVLVCGYWNGSRAIQVFNNGKGAKLIWAEEEKLRGLMAQPLYREGIIYLLDRTYGLTAFRLQTGEILWRDEHKLTLAGRNPHATLIWSNQEAGDALSLNAEGELVYLNLNTDGYMEYWRDQVCGKTWAHPAYSGNQVIVRDDRSLSCWELPLQ
ncbi:PQQ-binding-like beta-propeller repeat protein [Opitutales bacterium]|nr:PQQ-binding-like beta-propeller repeat protein [Opitutales bacterium]